MVPLVRVRLSDLISPEFLNGMIWYWLTQPYLGASSIKLIRSPLQWWTLSVSFSESLNISKTRSTKQNEDHSKESNFHQFWKRWWCIELSSSIGKFSNSAKISLEAYQTFFYGKSPSFPTLHILWASLEFSGFLIRRVDVFWRAKLPHFFSISIQAHQRQNIMDSFKWMQAAFLYLVTILNLICTYLTMMVTQSTRRSYGFKCFWMKLSDSFA